MAVGIGDRSVYDAALKALEKGGEMSYADAQSILRSTFDAGVITVQERDDLRAIEKIPGRMDGRARRMFRQFLEHIDRKSAVADMQAKATGNKNIGIPVPDLDPGPAFRFKTSLGKFSHGTFDVHYKPEEGILQVTLKVNYDWGSGLEESDKSTIRWRLRTAVRAWNNAGAYLETDALVLNPVVPLKFELVEVTSGEHFMVDVAKDERREWVGMDLNISRHTTAETLTHELGHVFGNYDEYGGSGIGGWIERRMWWHDNNYLTDTAALMAGGTEFRVRYFDHFASFLTDHFKKLNAVYVAKLKVA